MYLSYVHCRLRKVLGDSFLTGQQLLYIHVFPYTDQENHEDDDGDDELIMVMMMCV